MSEPTDWRALWPAAADGEYVHEFTRELSCLPETGAVEPPLTLAVACVATQASRLLQASLANEWALYTPRHAAIVASAVFAQAEAGATALRGVADMMGRMAARGDVTLPGGDPGPGTRADSKAGAGAVAQADAAPGAGADDAGLVRLRRAADELEAVVETYAAELVAALDRVPGPASLPANAHETLGAVAELLGKQAQFRDSELCGRVRGLVPAQPGADAVGRGREAHAGAPHVALAPRPANPPHPADPECSCEVTLTHRGEEWSFHRGDSAWSLLRLSDGRPTRDGGLIFSEWIDLDATAETAHPAHLAALIRAALPN